jgi:hypothetical protein
MWILAPPKWPEQLESSRPPRLSGDRGASFDGRALHATVDTGLVLGFMVVISAMIKSSEYYGAHVQLSLRRALRCASVAAWALLASGCLTGFGVSRAGYEGVRLFAENGLLGL